MCLHACMFSHTNDDSLSHVSVVRKAAIDPHVGAKVIDVQCIFI